MSGTLAWPEEPSLAAEGALQAPPWTLGFAWGILELFVAFVVLVALQPSPGKAQLWQLDFSVGGLVFVVGQLVGQRAKRPIREKKAWSTKARANSEMTLPQTEALTQLISNHRGWYF